MLGRPPGRPREIPQEVRDEIADMWMEARGLSEIARILTEEGVPTPGGKAWQHSTVRRVLEGEKCREPRGDWPGVPW
jgi:hypothetical protein